MKLRYWAAAVLFAVALTPAAAQRNIERPGTIAHGAAATSFPEQVEGFRRVAATQFDERGENIGVTYETASDADRVRLSVYVYPSMSVNGAPADSARAQNCRAELDAAGAALTQVPQYRGVRRIEVGDAPAVEGVGRGLGLHSVHSFSSDFLGADQEVRSETYLYCYVGGRWQVKYRISAPAGHDLQPAIESFIRSGPWPGRNPSPDETVMRIGRDQGA